MSAPVPTVDYEWACRACGSRNAAGAHECAGCGFPAVASALEIERHARGERGPRTLTPSEARRARRRLGLVWLGIYVAVIALLGLLVAARGGGEAGMVLYFATLPWPAIGYFLLGHGGTMLGFWAGFLLNGVVAYGTGWALSWLLNRGRTPA